MADELLLRLVLSVGHTIGCKVQSVPCTCENSVKLRLAHGEACAYLRAKGVLK